MKDSGAATKPEKDLKDSSSPVDPKTFMTPNFEGKFDESKRLWFEMPKPHPSSIYKIHILNVIFVMPFIIWNLYLLIVIPSRYVFILRHCSISLFPAIVAILSTTKFQPGFTRCQTLISIINFCWIFYGFCLVPVSLTAISTTAADCDMLINMCYWTESVFRTKMSVGIGAQVLYGYFLIGEGKRMCLISQLRFFSVKESVSITSSLSFSRDETYSVEYEPEEKEQKKEKNPADIIIAA